MVLQVLPDTGQSAHGVDTERAEVVGSADTGELQQLRGVERAARHDHLAGVDMVAGPSPSVVDPGAAGAVEHESLGLREGHQVEVRAFEDRMEIGAGRAETTAAVDVLVEGREALLTEAVHVIGDAESGLPSGLEPGGEQGSGRRPALQLERTVTATPLIGPGEAGLHPFEVGEAVRVTPVRETGQLRPLLVVGGIAALEDHAVDARTATEHLAARVVEASTAHVLFGLGLVAPVVETVADGIGEGGRHVDEHIPAPVGAAGLEHQHPVRRVRAQTVRERAAR